MPEVAAPPSRRKERVKLTDAAVGDLPLQGPDEKYPPIYCDTEVKGFYVLCHRTSKSYYVQHDIAGKSVVVHVGPVNAWTAQKARKQALAHKLAMKNGINPNDDRKTRSLEAAAKAETEAFTLADAVRLHLYQRKKERSDKTIAEYKKIFDTHLAHLMDKPMTWLGANQAVIENLHDKITREGWDRTARGGRGHHKQRRPAPYAANGMVRAYRAVYNYTREKRKQLGLPEFEAIEMNTETARDSSLTLEQLPVWYDAVIKLPNPIRRDFQLFTLFTGNRSSATQELRWEHVDLSGAVNGVPSVYIPTPKGGRAKAFFIPLSQYLVQMLTARRACNATNAAFPDSPWVFPALDSETGHIEEPTEKRNDYLKQFSPHALRHSYITFAQWAGVKLMDIGFLVNHRPKSITAQYMKALLPPLSESQEQITHYIKSHLCLKRRARK